MQINRELPSQEILQKAFLYDPDTGQLKWTRNRRMKSKGGIAGCMGNGYVIVGIGGRQYAARRIIWKWVHDHEPAEIDHINGDRSDNRLCNLRAANKALNMLNRRLVERELPRGVEQIAKQRFASRAFVNGEGIHLGYFSSPDDASVAYERHVQSRWESGV